MKRICLLLSILLTASWGSAQIIHVPDDHSTIQAAIDASNDGDTVLVAEGRYYENISYHGKKITVGSQYLIDQDRAHISKTIIDGSKPVHADTASVVRLENCVDSTVVIKGITICGGAGTVKNNPITGAKIRVAGGIFLDGGKAEDNIVTDNHIVTNIYTVGGGISNTPREDANVVIRGNEIYNNSLTSTGMVQGGGIYAKAGDLDPSWPAIMNCY